jgi:hypothetical protein
VATVSLELQIAIFALLWLGFELKRRAMFRLHGFVMLAALAVHLAIIFAIMVPAFVEALIPITIKNPTSLIGLLSPLHAATGSVAAALGVWVICAWRFRRSTQYCAPKKRVMYATFFVWLVSLALGVLLYFVLNWKVLFG